MEIAASAFDAILLLRVLALRLHRTYQLITLACFLEVFFDGIGLWLGNDSPEMARLFLYDRFLYAVLFPMVVWDVFEEVKSQIDKIRKLAVARLLSGLILAALFGCVLTLVGVTSEENGEQSLIATMGLVLWAGSSTACLSFLWTLHRRIRTDKLEAPRNTFVWMIYYELVLLGELTSCFFLIVAPFLNKNVEEAINLVFLLFGMTITGWCIIKLRALPSDVPSAPEKASL